MDMLSTSYDEDSAQYPPPIKDETLEEIRRTRYPTAARANLRQSPPSSPETLPGPRPLMDITNTEGHNDGQNSFPTAARTNLRRSPSSSLEAPRPQTRNIDLGNHRNNQDSFRDILNDEPVLSPMSNLKTRDESDEDSQGNASTDATFAGYGRDDREESTGDHSSDSSGSSMRDARFERPPTRGFIRPR